MEEVGFGLGRLDRWEGFAEETSNEKNAAS